MADALIDTNVLVYAADPSAPGKQRRAIEVLESLAQAGSGVLSAQCLSEYFAVVTRKIDPPIPAEQARRNLAHLCRIWPVAPLTAAVVLEAAQAAIRHGMSLWDAQIWAAAKQHGAAEVLSEDFTDGRTIEGIRFRNPFFDL
ncbi:MAG: PIN domain-containing protein [Candidatus Sumerlaeota bacterium]|nr:PIN domain-containing protein [Candidatus Sumerlaeota bacterium]